MIVIGPGEHDRVRIDVLGYERPERSGEFHDDNWLNCQVDVRVGGFTGRFSAGFSTIELGTLLGALQQLHKTLRGEAVFEPSERQLELHVACDRAGRLRMAGVAMDRAGDGHRLGFRLELDPTDLASTIRQLEATMQAYPIRT